jgi:hypothetical protein
MILKWMKRFMHDFLTLEIIEIKKVNNFLDILCITHEGFDFKDDEFIYCFHYNIKNIVFNEDIEHLINNHKRYSFGIFKKEKKIIFYEYKHENFDVYSDDHEREIVFENIEVVKIKTGYERQLHEIIKRNFELFNKEHNCYRECSNKINSLMVFLGNELEKTNRKIDFFKKENKMTLLNKNIGKQEILQKILKIMDHDEN